MKVLFVSSGNILKDVSPIIKNQGASLSQAGCDITYFTIQGKGSWGYLKNIPRLRKTYRQLQPDVVHAHYSLCGIVCALAGISNLVVSLMGSDVKAASWFKHIILLFSRLFWRYVIVKSEDMKQDLGYKNALVIPNGVNMTRFRPIPKQEALTKLSWNPKKKYIVFAASPDRKEKNFALAKAAYDKIAQQGYELKVLKNIPNEIIPYYFNAAEVVFLTSLWEGSPNVIKEAMACNRPIVCTRVGNVETLFKGCKACLLTDFSAEDCAQKLIIAANSNTSEGRQQLIDQALDANTVAHRLVDIYNNFSK